MAQQAYEVIESITKKAAVLETKIHIMQVWTHIEIYWLLNRWFFKQPDELETIKEYAGKLEEHSQHGTKSWIWTRREMKAIFAGAKIPYPASELCESAEKGIPREDPDQPENQRTREILILGCNPFAEDGAPDSESGATSVRVTHLDPSKVS